MKLVELRKDGHSAYVHTSQVGYMLSQGWEVAPTYKLKGMQ